MEGVRDLSKLSLDELKAFAEEKHLRKLVLVLGREPLKLFGEIVHYLDPEYAVEYFYIGYAFGEPVVQVFHVPRKWDKSFMMRYIEINKKGEEKL